MSAFPVSSFSSLFFLILRIPFSLIFPSQIFLIVVHFDLLMSRPHTRIILALFSISNCDRFVLEIEKSELRFNRDGNANTLEQEVLSNRNVHGLIVVPYKQPTRIEINRREAYGAALSRAIECGTGPSGRKEIKSFIVTQNCVTYPYGLFLLEICAQRVYRVCTRINYIIVTVTN